MCGILLLNLLDHTRPHNSSTRPTYKLTKNELLVSLFWLFNPLVMTISCRGNAEALVALLVLSTAYFLIVRDWLVAAAVCYALSVHFKVYPIIYAFSIYLFLCFMDSSGSSYRYRFFTRRSVTFALTSFAVFVMVTWGMFHIYGWDFLDNAYLYHIGRRDHRHNFSLYHLYIYLTYNIPSTSSLFSLATFLPQLLLILGVSFVFNGSGIDLLAGWFLSTLVFVSYNKVITSQYFIWFISLLPFALAVTSIEWKWRGIGMLLIWFGAQALWLSQAYRLEMLGQNTFLEIWIAGIVLFLVHNWIVAQFISHHQFHSQKSATTTRKQKAH